MLMVSLSVACFCLISVSSVIWWWHDDWCIISMCSASVHNTLLPWCVWRFLFPVCPVRLTDSGPVSSVVDDLRAALSKLECRVTVLEKSPAAVTPAPTPSVPYTNVSLYRLLLSDQSPCVLVLFQLPYITIDLLCKHVILFTLFRALPSSRRAAPRLKRRWKRRRRRRRMMILTCLGVMMTKRQRSWKNRGWKSTQRRSPRSLASSPSLPSCWMSNL